MLSNVIAALYFIAVMLKNRHNTTLGFALDKDTFNKDIAGEVLSVGLPACLMTLCENISFAVLDNLMAAYGTAMQAGLGVAKKVNMLAHCMARGMAQGVLPLIGYNFGAKNFKRVRAVNRCAIRILLATLQGVGIDGIGQTPLGANTAVSLLEAEGDALRVVYRDDNSHLVERGLSTFARQSWWKDKNMVESGEGYAPLPEDRRAEWHIPAGSQATGVWYGDALIGAFALADEGDALRLTQYALAPEWRGKGLGIPPMGQVIDACLKKGRPALRISCPDKALRLFFARLGFVPTVGEDMEKDVRRILPPVPAAYRP